MKLEFLLTRASALAFLATFVALAINAPALSLFAGAAGAWVLLIATSDYARRPRYASALAVPSRRGATLPLAA